MMMPNHSQGGSDEKRKQRYREHQAPDCFSARHF
jgi:hypothetical protein